MATPDLPALKALLQAEPLDLDALEQALDASDDATRLAFVHSLGQRAQRRLFDAAKGRTVTLEAIVPTGHGSLKEVIHEGQNTLPAFNHFQKRFCLPTEGNARSDKSVLWGYNHLNVGAFTGPGYFVAYDDADAGEVVIDYRELPPEKPGEWPEIISNKKKLGRVIYAGMVDRVRRVSAHVTIGRAYKNKPMNAWFALVRQG